MENTVRVVLGVLSLAVGMAYVVRLLADWPRRPDHDRGPPACCLGCGGSLDPASPTSPTRGHRSCGTVPPPAGLGLGVAGLQGGRQQHRPHLITVK